MTRARFGTAMFLALSAVAVPAAGQVARAETPSTEDRALLRAILAEAVSVPTVKGRGKVPELASKFAERLTSAGFPAQDIKTVSLVKDGEPVVGFLARYAGRDAKAKPLVLIGHMDVVGVTGEAWEQDPFQLTEKGDFLFGRGVADNKGGLSALLATFIRLKRAGYVPQRDIVLAFSGDEETGMETTPLLANHPFVARAEYALNTDAGGGGADASGNVELAIQFAEKTYADFTIAASGTGGHSAYPPRNNAIYNLGTALEKIRAIKFPIVINEVTLPRIKEVAEGDKGAVGKALRALMANPDDGDARTALEGSSFGMGQISTTCVATVLRAGEAPNSVPERATATVNCRVLPGMTIEAVTAKLVSAVDNPDVKINVEGRPGASPITPPNPKMFAAVQDAARKVYPGAKLTYVMGVGGTDGRVFRSAGIPTYGVGVIVRQQGGSRAHGANERIPVRSFYGQLTFWDALLRKLGGR